MAKVASIGSRRKLTNRRMVTVELPEFLVQALEARVATANTDLSFDEQISLDELLELHLAETLTIGEIALLEQTVPGIGAAATDWLRAIN